jgi:U2 small nuclear ribonucleoprotein A'
LDKVLQSLKPLSNLKHLDLYDNPVAQEPNYKLRVLYALPTLEILDRHKISHQERKEAVKFMAGSKGKSKSSKKPFSW